MRSVRRIWPALLALCLLLSGCRSGADAAAHDRQLIAMDTFMSLTTYGPAGASALDAAQDEIVRLERLLSVTDPDSELARLNAGGRLTVSRDTAELISFALEMAGRTGGAVNPAVYPLVRAWGFTGDAYRVPARQELDALLPLTDWRAVDVDGTDVTLPAGAQLDLGSVAKGWAGDRVLALWREAGLTSGILRLGGNVQTLGAKPDGSPWRVGIRDPEGEGTLAVVAVRGLAVVTSGSYERFFVQDGRTYCHIIDPATGCPADSGLVSVTVVAERGAYCDALSTALFVLGAEEAARLWRECGDFEAVLIGADGSILITAGLRECFSLTEEFASRKVQVIS